MRKDLKKNITIYGKILILFVLLLSNFYIIIKRYSIIKGGQNEISTPSNEASKKRYMLYQLIESLYTSSNEASRKRHILYELIEKDYKTQTFENLVTEINAYLKTKEIHFDEYKLSDSDFQNIKDIFLEFNYTLLSIFSKQKNKFGFLLKDNISNFEISFLIYTESISYQRHMKVDEIIKNKKYIPYIYYNYAWKELGLFLIIGEKFRKSLDMIDNLEEISNFKSYLTQSLLCLEHLHKYNIIHGHPHLANFAFTEDEDNNIIIFDFDLIRIDSDEKNLKKDLLNFYDYNFLKNLFNYDIYAKYPKINQSDYKIILELFTSIIKENMIFVYIYEIPGTILIMHNYNLFKKLYLNAIYMNQYYKDLFDKCIKITLSELVNKIKQIGINNVYNFMPLIEWDEIPTLPFTQLFKNTKINYLYIKQKDRNSSNFGDKTFYTTPEALEKFLNTTLEIELQE